MNTYYLSHHGITGMKWGVWNEETRRKRMGGNRRSASRAKRIEKQLNKANATKNAAKAEKRIKKAAYLQELDSPGSTKLDTKFLNRKRLKNIAATCYSGYAAVSNILSAATGPAAIPLYSAAWGPIAGPAIGVGLAAFNAAAAAGWTKVTLGNIERASSLNNSISNRKASNQKKNAKI